MGGVVKGAGVELCVICVQLSLNKAWSFENIPFCSATHVLWISRTYVLTIEAAERSVLLSGRESTIWFTYIVAGWQARAHYDLACSLALIYCTSSFYVRFKAGSVHHIGSFIIFFFCACIWHLSFWCLICTASPFVYFGSLYHKLELFMNSIKRDRCGRLFCSSCLGLGFSSDRGFQQHLHMWLRISGTSRSTENKAIKSMQRGENI